MKKTIKIVINANYGGFYLSSHAVKYLAQKKSELVVQNSIEQYIEELEKVAAGKLSEIDRQSLRRKIYDEYTIDLGDGFKGHSLYPDTVLKGNTIYWVNINKSQRTHPDLVEVIEKLGDKASHQYSKLCIVEIPADIEWEIGNYVGMEWIAEKHRKWFCNEVHRKLVCG